MFFEQNSLIITLTFSLCLTVFLSFYFIREFALYSRSKITFNNYKNKSLSFKFKTNKNLLLFQIIYIVVGIILSIIFSLNNVTKIYLIVYLPVILITAYLVFSNMTISKTNIDLSFFNELYLKIMQKAEENSILNKKLIEYKKQQELLKNLSQQILVKINSEIKKPISYDYLNQYLKVLSDLILKLENNLKEYNEQQILKFNDLLKKYIETNIIGIFEQNDLEFITDSDFDKLIIQIKNNINEMVVSLIENVIKDFSVKNIKSLINLLNIYKNNNKSITDLISDSILYVSKQLEKNNFVNYLYDNNLMTINLLLDEVNKKNYYWIYDERIFNHFNKQQIIEIVNSIINENSPECAINFLKCINIENDKLIKKIIDNTKIVNDASEVFRKKYAPYTREELEKVLLSNSEIDYNKVTNENVNFTFSNNDQYYTPLTFAICHYSYKEIKALIEKGANVNPLNGMKPIFPIQFIFPLLELVNKDNYSYEEVKLLIENGANVNEENIVGFTPFFNVAYDNNLEIARFLQKNGANVHVVNFKGVNAIGNCLAGDFNVKFFEYLVNIGVDYTKVDKDGETIYNYSLRNPKAKKYSGIFFDAINKKISKDEMLFYLNHFDEYMTRKMMYSNNEINQLKVLINDFLNTVNSFNTKTCYYPDYLEDLIQLAVSYKRKANYLAAAKLYLDIFKKENKLYGSILMYLYKVLACSGLITEAIKTIKLGEKIYKDSGAEASVPAFIRAITPSVYESHYNRLIQSFERESTLYSYLKDISGNVNYKFNISYSEMLQDLNNYLKYIQYYKNNNLVFNDLNEISKTEKNNPINKEVYYIIGVRFSNTNYGCYYYRCHNDKYNLNDKLLVPTRNGLQSAYVVFKRTYYNKNDLPVALDILKWAPLK